MNTMTNLATINFSTLKVKEIRDIGRELGVRGFSKMPAADLVKAIQSSDAFKDAVAEQKRVARKEANDELALRLGPDKGRAIAFFSHIHGRKPRVDETDLVCLTFKVMTCLHDNVVTEAPLRKIACKVGELYMDKRPASDFEAMTNEEASEYIRSAVDQFYSTTYTEAIKKDQYKILKASLDDVQYDGASFFINSDNAAVLTQQEIKMMREQEGGKLTAMRVVETAENGVSRTLELVGADKTYVMLCLDAPAKSEYSDGQLKFMRQNILANGFYDIKTGVHYVFGVKGASMGRKANQLFIEGKDWNDTFKLWFSLTGTKDKDGFVDAFGTEVNPAKLLARVATRTSATVSVDNVNPEEAEKIKSANVLYVRDTETSVNRQYETIIDNAVVKGQSDRNITDADGQGLGSVSFMALVTHAIRRMTDAEYADFMDLWNEHIHSGGTLVTAKGTGRLESLINKIIKVFQIRHGEKKGLIVIADLETFENTKDYDLVIPDSVRKFIGGEWSEYPLEICNYLKKKDNEVNLNPQFISALWWEDPATFLEIVKTECDRIEDAMISPQKAMAFCRAFVDSDNDTGRIVSDALLSNAGLYNEPQVQKWMFAQVEKKIKGMMMGRVPVPGMYSYMIFDPNYFLNKQFGTDLHCLQAGEYYHNGKDCECAALRSPMLHYTQAQKVSLSADDAYWYLKDCLVFNGFDALADQMAGADFDGDMCAIVTSDTWQGKIVVDGVQKGTDIWAPAKAASKMYFVPDTTDKEAMNNLINYLVENSACDRTGLMTNYVIRATEICNTLRSLKFYAKKAGVDRIHFIEAKLFGKARKYGRDFAPFLTNDGKMMAKAICETTLDKNPATGEFKILTVENEYSIIGVKTLDELDEYIQKYDNLVKKGTLDVGYEIDGAKTGFHPTLLEQQEIRYTSHALRTRQETLGRVASSEEERSKFRYASNAYVSLSPWGLVCTYIKNRFYNADESLKEDTVLYNLAKNGVDKTHLLFQLLTNEEKDILLGTTVACDGKSLTLIEYLAERKLHYNEVLRKLFMIERTINAGGENEEETDRFKLSVIKDDEANFLIKFAEANHIPLTVVGAATYIATYRSTDSSKTNGHSFAWLFPDVIMEIFSRENKAYGWLRVPNNTEHASISNGILSINDRVYSRVDAHDDADLLVKYLGDRKYAWIRRKVRVTVEKSNSGLIIEPGSRTFVLKAMGFRYYAASGNITEWKRALHATNFTFDILENEEGRVVMSCNGCPIATLAHGKDLDLAEMSLIGHKVKIINTNDDIIKTTENSATNIKVVVIK